MGLLTGVFSSLGYLTPQWFGTLTWPQAILFGIVAALAAMLLFSVALALGAPAFRKLRPLTLPEIQPRTDDRTSAKLSELHKSYLAVIGDYQRMSGVEARVTEHLDKLKADIAPLVGVPAKLEMVRVDGAQTATAVEKLTQLVERNANQSHASFAAVMARERLPKFGSEIIRLGDALYDRLKSGETYDETMWKQWENTYSAWLSAVNQWCEIGKWYAASLEDRVFQIDDEKYGLVWGVNDVQFPSAEAVRRFKKFRILYTQWEAMRSSVDQGTYQVAYTGLSERDVRRG